MRCAIQKTNSLFSTEHDWQLADVCGKLLMYAIINFFAFLEDYQQKNQSLFQKIVGSPTFNENLIIKLLLIDMAKYILENLKTEYTQLFDGCEMVPAVTYQIELIVDRIISGKDSYKIVQEFTGVPWYFIGIIHSLECNCNFKLHLHNGDPITAKTIHAPVGYPRKWNRGMSWIDSARDALRLKNLHKWSDWSVPGMLFQLERYNGFGYRNKGINSPYLWSGSNHYTKGKFVSDGVYSPAAVSKQVGVALLLKKMKEKGVF